MISALLFMSIIGGDLDVCLKYDGMQPNPCEMALAQRMVEVYTALEGCAVAHQELEKQNEELHKLLLEQPVPVEPDSLSLFGLPGWVTPVTAVALVGLGLGVGLSL